MLSIVEGDDAIFHFDDPAVENGYFEDILSKVFQRSIAISKGLTVYDLLEAGLFEVLRRV